MWFVPPVPGKNPNHFTKIASRIAEEMNKKDPLSAFLAGQFDNLSNQNAHYLVLVLKFSINSMVMLMGLFALLERVEHSPGFQNI